jgi:hypothetical protein
MVTKEHHNCAQIFTYKERISGLMEIFCNRIIPGLEILRPRRETLPHRGTLRLRAVVFASPRVKQLVRIAGLGYPVDGVLSNGDE